MTDSLLTELPAHGPGCIETSLKQIAWIQAGRQKSTEPVYESTSGVNRYFEIATFFVATQTLLILIILALAKCCKKLKSAAIPGVGIQA